MKFLEKETAEQATGISENRHGIGKFYLSADCEVTPEQAYDAMRDDKAVEVPNAGAGSYRKFFEACGFTEVKTWDTCSSAGDWVFAVKDGDGGDWFPAFQSNRYPRHGFSYSVNFGEPFESFDQFCQVNQ